MAVNKQIRHVDRSCRVDEHHATAEADMCGAFVDKNCWSTSCADASAYKAFLLSNILTGMLMDHYFFATLVYVQRVVRFVKRKRSKLSSELYPRKEITWEQITRNHGFFWTALVYYISAQSSVPPLYCLDLCWVFSY
jgi:hypothetical protein